MPSPRGSLKGTASRDAVVLAERGPLSTRVREVGNVEVLPVSHRVLDDLADEVGLLNGWAAGPVEFRRVGVVDDRDEAFPFGLDLAQLIECCDNVELRGRRTSPGCGSDAACGSR